MVQAPERARVPAQASAVRAQASAPALGPGLEVRAQAWASEPAQASGVRGEAAQARASGLAWAPALVPAVPGPVLAKTEAARFAAAGRGARNRWSA